jgi:hypothetical protein
MLATQAVNGWSFRTRGVLAIGSLVAGWLCVSLPALAQESPQTTMTGTIVSSGATTLVVKDEAAHYWLFVMDRHTIKPATLPTGTAVRVISTQTEDPQVRLAVAITAEAPAAPSTATTPAQPDVVPTSIRHAESAIERDAKKFHFGVQAGVALDPEMVDIGVHARFGPFFTKIVQFRPGVDFAFGEITKLFALNGDFIVNLSPSPAAPRSFYFGLGPQFNFAERSASGEGVSFSDFHYSNALNILLGIKLRSGVWAELKTSVWAAPAPILRLMVGYTF